MYVYTGMYVYVPDEIVRECDRSETEGNGEHLVGHQLPPAVVPHEADDHSWDGINCLEEKLRTGFCSRFNTAG